jgi:hypothetical protein
MGDDGRLIRLRELKRRAMGHQGRLEASPEDAAGTIKGEGRVVSLCRSMLSRWVAPFAAPAPRVEDWTGEVCPLGVSGRPRMT